MNIHVFIDAENMPPKAALESYDFLKSEHNVYRCDVFGKWSTIPIVYKKYRSSKFRIQNSDFGKNSADLWMTVYIAKAIYEEREMELLAILSNDRDFAPIISLAVEKQKQVLLLVMESQYQGINNTLTKMNIDSNFVTLGKLKEEVKLIKIKTSQLPDSLKSYFRKFYSGNTIFVKNGDNFVEMPFIDGMRLEQFIHMMRTCNIWSKGIKGQRVKDEINRLSLKIELDSVWYQREEDL